MSEIKPEVLDLAAKLKAGITISKDGSTATVAEGLYEQNLPSNISMDVLKEAQKHNNVFIAAAGYAFGESAIDVMKKNAEISAVSISIPTVGKDTLDLTFKRESQFPNAGGEGTTTKYGTLMTKYNMYGTGSRGQVLKVKQELSEKATAVFGG